MKSSKMLGSIFIAVIEDIDYRSWKVTFRVPDIIDNMEKYPTALPLSNHAFQLYKGNEILIISSLDITNNQYYYIPLSHYKFVGLRHKNSFYDITKDNIADVQSPELYEFYKNRYERDIEYSDKLVNNSTEYINNRSITIPLNNSVNQDFVESELDRTPWKVPVIATGSDNYNLIGDRTSSIEGNDNYTLVGSKLNQISGIDKYILTDNSSDSLEGTGERTIYYDTNLRFRITKDETLIQYSDGTDIHGFRMDKDGIHVIGNLIFDKIVCNYLTVINKARVLNKSGNLPNIDPNSSFDNYSGLTVYQDLKVINKDIGHYHLIDATYNSDNKQRNLQYRQYLFPENTSTSSTGSTYSNYTLRMFSESGYSESKGCSGVVFRNMSTTPGEFTNNVILRSTMLNSDTHKVTTPTQTTILLSINTGKVNIATGDINTNTGNITINTQGNFYSKKGYINTAQGDIYTSSGNIYITKDKGYISAIGTDSSYVVNTIYGSVNASSISGTLAASNIPNISAGKITSGRLNNARLPTNITCTSITVASTGVNSGYKMTHTLSTGPSSTYDLKVYETQEAVSYDKVSGSVVHHVNTLGLGWSDQA